MKGHHFNKPFRVPNAADQVSRSSDFPFLRWRISMFLPYMCIACILIMWPRSNEQTKIFRPRWTSICTLVSFSPGVWEKILKLLNLRDLGLRSVNDLNLCNVSKFMKMIAQINFDVMSNNSFRNIHRYAFFPLKIPEWPNLTLTYNRSGST